MNEVTMVIDPARLGAVIEAEMHRLQGLRVGTDSRDSGRGSKASDVGLGDVGVRVLPDGSDEAVTVRLRILRDLEGDGRSDFVADIDVDGIHVVPPVGRGDSSGSRS